MKKWMFAIFAVNLIALSAFADIYIEPSLGYNFGSFKTKTVGLGDSSGSASGLGLGLKAGYSFTMLFAGLDFQYNMLTSKFDTAGQADQDVNQTMIGLTAGVDLMLFRAWLGYYFSAKNDVDGGSNFSGSAFKIGAGYKIIPMVSLNAEYVMLTFDDVEPANTLFDKTTANGILISVSVPLSI